MKPLSKQILAIGFLLTAAILIGGCIFIDGVNLKAKWEKAEDHTIPLAAGSEVQVDTHNGFIVVRGADTQQCHVEAKIQVRAETDQIAQEIAKQTQILLQEANQLLIIKLDKPETKEKHSISVDYTLTVPRQTHLEVTSHNGKLEFSDLLGDVDCQTHNGKISFDKIEGKCEAETHNGDIHCRQVDGWIKLCTHNGAVTLEHVTSEIKGIEVKSYNGKIRCNDIIGDLNAETHNGSVNVVYNHAANPAANVHLVTYNDSIHLTPPPGLSATVELSTKNGSVHSEPPIRLQGDISKNKIKGVIGNGEGRIYLHTHNGSIRIH